MTASAVLVLACECGTTPGRDGGTGGGMGGSGGGAPTVTGRCDFDLTDFTSGTGTTRAKQISSTSELIGGPNAHGRVGDYLLENDKIRVVIQGDGRLFGPQPFGGTILDADLVRSGPGRDQFGELGLLYNFGRTIKPERFEVLNDGSNGKSAVLAVTGVDSPNDYLSIRNKLAESLGRVPLADPVVPVPLRITNYFVLNPGEQRVRFISALCNQSNVDTLGLAVGDLTDPGYVLEFLNPKSCTKGFGYGGLCFGLDVMNWYGYQGDGVAYGYAPNKSGNPTAPELQNATLSIAGITGSILGANGLSGLVSWINPSAAPRDGEVRLGPNNTGIVSRDFWVAANLGELSNLIETARAAATTSTLGTLRASVTSSGVALAGARVAIENDQSRVVMTTNDDGGVSARLTPGSYRVSAWAPAREPTAKQTIQISGDVPASVSFALTAPRKLTVNVREVGAGPIPAKVTVLCPSGPCPTAPRNLVLYFDNTKDPQPDNVQLIGFVDATGSATFELPPAQYLVLVSRGPEYSIFPNTYPTTPGALIDLTTADAVIDAPLAHVIDTTGWMSADFHVHAVNSPDSIVDNASRALGFAADGVDVLVSTDHDVVTDYAPIIASTGLSPFLASVVGEEVSPMEFGHYNLFPLVRDPNDPVSGGAVDWANPNGLALSPRRIFEAGRAKGARTVHFNHPRGFLGGFTFLRVDTDTLATHTDPASLSMLPATDATANDTKLVSSDFNAIEIFNPAEDSYSGVNARPKINDWFTLLSRGLIVTATGVSDSHTKRLATGWRTWVELGRDSPAGFDGNLLSARVNEHRAVASNAPFVKLEVFRVDASGAQVTTPIGIGAVLARDTKDVGVTVDVQVPEYLDVTKVELYMHKPSDDARCPIDPMGPNAATTRVACDGNANMNWPASSVTATQNVMLTPGDLQTVTTEGTTVFKRYRKRVTFRLPTPTTDNWLVAMVYGSKSLTPLQFNQPGLMGGVTATTPFALTNAVFIDADGNGYDHPPFNVTLGARTPAPTPKKPQGLSPQQVMERWGHYFGHD